MTFVMEGIVSEMVMTETKVPEVEDDKIYELE
jgi:hypothetical protein